MKTRATLGALQKNGTRFPRKLREKTCPVCGEVFQGRAEVKACGDECTAVLRSISAKCRNGRINRPLVFLTKKS